MALDALAGEPVHVVATFPAGVPPGITTPANATVCQFVPHSLVLDRAACAITHGGMGITQKALVRGVPVCVVPVTDAISSRSPDASKSRNAELGCCPRTSPLPGYATRFCRPWR